MTDDSPGFWRRLSRRTKIVIIVDLVVLAVVLGAAVIFLGDPWSKSSTSDAASTTSTTTTAPESPLRTTYGLAWIVAACGGAMTLQDLPNSPLPQAQDYAVCLAPGSGASIVIGTYRNRSELDEDVADLKVAHRMATNTDDHGNAWLVVVEGDSVAPLQPLQRYGFQVQ
ncbi:hypothetical protein SAMN04489835_2065 [Mycolicibacterium rutilum]|uniref:Uncharacterized protein n=1 Tax=Mycolicibacterium rutilum TaxID=370526 RepID=A0A1H6JHB4_MYCRU|nr:hypothetical protein [Mycolicibacterium rutilum]SEH61671.1 hypothetical protein SAMN04489835_2065 [Mycolicibacterium rutilum]